MSIIGRRRFVQYFIPQYDEISLFAMSLTCILLISSAVHGGNMHLRMSLWDFNPRIVVAAFVFVSGLLLSLYHAFTDRPKTPLEKSFMLFFAVLLNCFSGIMAGMYELSISSGWIMIFPLVNIFNCIVLFLIFRTGILSESNISDQHASNGKFIVTAVAVLILFVISHYYLSLIWMQTLSICVAYATNVSRAVPLFLLQEEN